MNISHIKKVIRYGYHFSMIIICVVSLFFIWGPKAHIEFSNLNNITTLMLAVIGFLFAFAGINIYSIFNTNIDEEKNRLNELVNSYRSKLQFTIDQWDYSKKLIKYYQTCQMIIDSKEFNAQIYDWVFSIERQVVIFSDYLIKMYNCKQEREYVSFKQDLLDITRGINIQLSTFEEKMLTDGSSFWVNVKENDKKCFVDAYNNMLKKTNEFALSLQKTDYPQDESGAIPADSNEKMKCKRLRCKGR